MSTILCVASVATMVGTAALVNFDITPGLPSRSPESWPRSSKIQRVRGAKHLVVIAHPQCGCTAATLQELSSFGGTGIQVSVLFYRPGPDSHWEKGRAWQQVSEIEGASAQWDDGAKEAKFFGGTTSGSVLLFGEEGKLLFHGGITGSRGHVGANHGLAQLELALRTGVPSNFVSLFSDVLCEARAPAHERFGLRLSVRSDPRGAVSSRVLC